jgi:hypothetical protein
VACASLGSVGRLTVGGADEYAAGAAGWADQPELCEGGCGCQPEDEASQPPSSDAAKAGVEGPAAASERA